MTQRDTATAGKDGALLELKLIGNISGQFYVPRYQRGYRWGAVEVGCLLDDIWDSKGEPYSLQPVVVKQRSEDEWELVDGQQRLTTLYLIFLYMQREGLQSAGPTYSMEYETRPKSQSYLQELDRERSDSNIDYFHIFTAYNRIRTWFENHGQRRQYVANKFYGYLFESVRVIWYVAPHELDSTTLFTRLNVGRIPLTDAELVKALLLSRNRQNADKTGRAHEVAAQWDGIERDLRAPEVWAFVSGTRTEDSPTRITLLLDTLAGGPKGRERLPFHTFDTLRQRIEVSPEAVWNDVLDLHALVLGWYANRDLYHKIGYLVAVGHDFSSLVSLAQGQTKSSFEALLDERIRTTLELTPSGVLGLSYETDAHKEKCSRVLLLMNVETVRQMEHSSERYSFRLHRSGSWSLEHIHAQNAENLTKAEQWKEWLRLHCEALAALPNIDEERRDELIAKIGSVSDEIGREAFQSLAREVTELFTLGDESAQATLHSMHSVSNLALLSSNDNSALGNSVFEVKRRLVLELDRKGAYIPVCTRQVFLKYYTDANAQQIHFWGEQDRESYLAAMLATKNGGIGNYLRPEERES